MDHAAESAARAALKRVLGAPAARGAGLQALAGGIHLRSFIVSAGRDRFVLRLPTPGAKPLLDVGTEASVMRAAAAAGLAPEVAAVDAAAGILLTEYHAGARSWSAADARRPRNIQRAAALLRALHALSARAPEFAAEPIARSYLSVLSAGVDAVRARFDARERAWANELVDVARHYDGAHAPKALCHNDLVAANVLDDGSLVLVDFEYAVRGAPVLDLASLAGMNDYGARECRELLTAYGPDETGHTVSVAELTKIVRMVRLMAYFWARVGALRVADAGPYRQLAAGLAAKLE